MAVPACVAPENDEEEMRLYAAAAASRCAEMELGSADVSRDPKEAGRPGGSAAGPPGCRDRAGARGSPEEDLALAPATDEVTSSSSLSSSAMKCCDEEGATADAAASADRRELWLLSLPDSVEECSRKEEEGAAPAAREADV
jgi:hypothetical protein